MGTSFWEEVCDTMNASSPGAQTERRGDAGPVQALLVGEAAPAPCTWFDPAGRTDQDTTVYAPWMFASLLDALLNLTWSTV